MRKILIICGPTATGKTELAMSLAEKFNGEIISADSRQVYKGVAALTGKDSSKAWLYDVVNLDEEFSVNHWMKLVKEVIADIESRNKLPIVVGGTGLYLQALVNPFETIDIVPNQKLRQDLQKLTVSKLQQMLPRGKMNQSDWNNPRRLIRAIEVGLATKDAGTGNLKQDFTTIWIGLTADKTRIKGRILERLKNRWEKALEEVQSLSSKLTAQANTILGLREIRLFLEGKLTKEQTINQWARGEFAYAKRQITWFKKRPGIYWFDCDDPRLTLKVTELIDSWYTVKNDFQS